MTALHTALRDIVGVFGLALLVASPLVRAAPADIEVMVLGTYHMDNPGLDVINARIGDVTTPTRQHELADVADRLARFKPTRIAIEVTPKPKDQSGAKACPPVSQEKRRKKSAAVDGNGSLISSLSLLRYANRAGL